MGDDGGSHLGGGEVVGVEPEYFVVVSEPCHLLLGIDAGVLLDSLHSHVEGPFTVEVTEKFFIAYGVEGIEMPQWINTSCFFEQSVGHHLIDSSVDPVEKDSAFPF